MRRMGDDCSEIAQPMHNLDVGLDVLVEVPPGTDVGDQFTGGERGPRTVVDAHAVLRGRRQLVSVDRGVAIRNHRPRVRVGGRLAGEVSRIELCEGGANVVGVERDERRDPLVDVDVDYL